jgi:GNAT superfamily N-acetyltransferase
MAVRVEPVRSAGELKRFIMFPWRVYRGKNRYPCWVPPLLLSEKDLFNASKHPFWAHTEHQHFLAYRGTEIVGRISAILDHNYVQFHEEKVAFFGFFEAFDDREVAAALFDAVAGWAKAKGMVRMMGPMNPSADQILGVLIDSFDIPPIVQMGYNAPYYPGLYDASGLSKDKDLFCYRLFKETLPLSDKIRRVAELVQKRQKITLRTIDMKHFKAEVERIRELYNDAWEKNWGFVPWTREEFDFMANDLKLVADPRIVLIAEAGGKPIGVSIPIPDVHQIFIKMNGRLLPFGIFRLLLGRKKVDIMRLAIMGVAKGYHNQGVDALMVYETYKRGSAVGYRGAEISWVIEDNFPMRNLLDNWGAEHYRTYRVYTKPLA